MPEQARSRETPEEMPQPKPLAVSAARIRPLIDMAGNAKLDLAGVLKDARLPATFSASEADGAVALASFFRLQQAVSRALEDEACKMSERQLMPGTTDFVLSRLSGCRSLAEAMRELATYYNLIHGGEYNTVRKKGGLIVFSSDDRNFPYTIEDEDYLRFSMECVQIWLHSMLASISEETADAALRRVSIRREKGPASDAHLAFWRAPIRHGEATYVLEYDDALMEREIAMPAGEPLTASRVYEEAILLIERREGGAPSPLSIAAKVRAALAKNAVGGALDQKRAATMLDMSVATLRRRLADEGVSFRDLRRDALNDAAKAMLSKRRAIAEIADELGFSDFRSFNRAFRDWNGVTPSAWRTER